jgi:hypothetical protein
MEFGEVERHFEGCRRGLLAVLRVIFTNPDRELTLSSKISWNFEALVGGRNFTFRKVVEEQKVWPGTVSFARNVFVAPTGDFS